MMLTACQNDVDFTQEDMQNAATKVDDNAIQFGTYLSNSGLTRAGFEGSIDTDTLKRNSTHVSQTAADGANGFGVFAYYTGTKTYNETNYYYNSAAVANENKIAPNFMYNQRVYWDESATTDYITHWTYSPIKYWPNELQASGSVDDQEGNRADDPATTTNSNGGYVSFFAYAPFVDVTASDGIPNNSGMNYNGGTTDGITAITSNGFKGDPKITYKIATDGKIVDLLWGTYSGTSENVISETAYNLGVDGDNDANNDFTAGGLYRDAILGSYKLNADLTKQKTTGTIGFNFKHALAKVGGSSTFSNVGTTPTNGLMAVLDLDDLKGAETGGTKGVNTVVTIESIVIKTKEIYYDNNHDGTDDENGYVVGGIFNLATGQWESYIEGSQITHKITQSKADDGSNAVLATSIAEPVNVTSMSIPAGKSDYYANGTVEGVTTTAKNVYENETNPFVFIPGTKPSFNVTVTYYVRTFDANLANTSPAISKSGESGTWSNVKQTISKDVSFTDAVKLNKQYNLLMHIGLTGVKFTATVSKWVVDGDDNEDGVIGAGEDVRITDVYVPINVSELQAAAPASTVAPGSQECELQLDNIVLTYSDAADTKTIGKDDFSKEGLTFTSSDNTNASVDASGKISFKENASASSRAFTITVTRGNQTASFNVTQPAPILNAIAMSFAESTVPTAGGTITPTVTASYKNTDNSNNAYAPTVTASATYQVADADAALTAGTLTVNAGTSGEPIKVKATYNDGTTSKDITVNDASTLKYE